MLHTSYPTCMYLRSRVCFSGRYRHLMSTTQLDRSRSPTMPCILLVYIYIEKSLPAVRLAPITGAAHTVIPIQRQHAHTIATSALETVSLQKARRKRRHDYPDAKVETERSVPYSLRRRRKIVAALKLPRPESVQTEIEERGVSREGKGHTI